MGFEKCVVDLFVTRPKKVETGRSPTVLTPTIININNIINTRSYEPPAEETEANSNSPRAKRNFPNESSLFWSW